MDWSHDPTLKAMRLEFAASLAERKQELDLLVATGDLKGLQEFAHRLVGVALTYEFNTVGAIASLLENHLTHKRNLENVTGLLSEALSLSTQGVDPVQLNDDPRMQECACVAESSHAESKNESSLNQPRKPPST